MRASNHGSHPAAPTHYSTQWLRPSFVVFINRVICWGPLSYAVWNAAVGDPSLRETADQGASRASPSWPGCDLLILMGAEERFAGPSCIQWPSEAGEGMSLAL